MEKIYMVDFTSSVMEVDKNGIVKKKRMLAQTNGQLNAIKIKAIRDNLAKLEKEVYGKTSD